jgi:hypothetical protein
MLNIFRSLKRSTKIKLMISLFLFLSATVCLYNMLLLMSVFGYFFGGCILGDLLAEVTDEDR